MDTITLWARNGDAVRQAIELGELVHLDTASEELTDEFLLFAMDSGLLKRWATSFPDPRREPEISMEVLVASHLAARFTGLYSMRQSGYVLRSASVLGAMGYSVEVLEPIRLRFNNITSMLRATAEATSGWGQITLPPDAPLSVEIPVRLIKSGDRLKLDVFYTQKEMSLVDVQGAGRFADGEMRPFRDNFRPWRVGISLSLVAFYLLPLLIFIIDRWLFQFPMGIFYIADAILDKHPWWLLSLGWMFWFLSAPEIRSWLLGHLRRLRHPADTQESTMVHFEVEPQTPELST